jgi:ATP-dependent Lon protease
MGELSVKRSKRKSNRAHLNLGSEIFFPGTILSVLVRTSTSQRIVQQAYESNRSILLQFKDSDEIRLLAEIQQLSSHPEGHLRVLFKGLRRASIDGKVFEEIFEESPAIIATHRVILERYEELSSCDPSLAIEWLSQSEKFNLSELCDQVAHHLPVPTEIKSQIFNELDVNLRAGTLLSAVQKELEVAHWKSSIQQSFENKLEASRKEIYLREQIRSLQALLNENQDDDLEELSSRISGSLMPDRIILVCQKELRKLRSTALGGTEEQIIRNYLDVLLEMPWGIRAEEKLNLLEAEKTLKERHLGQESVKERVLEYLSIRRLRGTRKGDVICLLGPPGVGKTSMAHAIGEALSRPVGHISLGGLRDDAELRGHRRTYVGSRPGRIVQSIKSCGVTNPILILDEIDKMVSNHQGDPMSALLEVLDSGHHSQFVDHYLEVPIDLSEVLFVATANSLDEIPEPLLDRMEVIEFSGYTESERIEIARDYMLPAAISEVGLSERFPKISNDAFISLCREYSRESGVRGLKREIDRLARKLAREFLKFDSLPETVEVSHLRHFLGEPYFEDRKSHRECESGTSYGLVVSSYGGDVIAIEVSLHRPVAASPSLMITGGAGKVMEESISTALTCVRAILDQKGVDSRFDVHVHLPQAAIKKDGPSAGITIATALFSAFTGRKIRNDVAMTGEITLRGRLLAVGGLREKILAADRAGFTTVLYPASQKETVQKIMKEVHSEMQCVPIESLSESFAYSIQVADHAQTVNIL